ncbi:hypothetical protein F383_19422 [Gossypium arboreum]|uniref:Uncharacterized protein n=1 Tax=Gossypium arboreum TaxID=29729 RepID=A0A0B0NGK0_GOSAR|nr:hypothetical protein F383_19422 [Gossypium arboreum]
MPSRLYSSDLFSSQCF